MHLALLTISARVCIGALIASGKIEQCANTGNEDLLAGCTEKIVVSLSLTSGQDSTESLYATLASVTDKNGETKMLQTPWSISLSKTEVYHRYPLEYIQSFNAQPYEKVVNVGGLGVFTECDEQASSNTPTCGWAIRADGSRDPHSQGYCCQCDAFSKSSSRAQGDCDFWGLGLTPATAHCLRWGELWYVSYSLGSPETYFNINVALSVDLETQEIMKISPETPGALSSDGRVAARLIGDFASWKQIPDYDDFLLFVPSHPVTNSRVTDPPEKTWMLIRRNDITFDGLACNKIGVSYESFRHESGKCQNNPGSCLRNQLEDFHEAGRNFLDDYGKLGLLNDSVIGQIYLSFEAETTQTSLVTLTMDATDVKFVINVSHGKFVSCVIADFESMSREGIVICSVRNEGKVKATFHVSITECSNGIKPMLGQTKTIDNTANTTAQFVFDVRSENILDSSHFCMAYLYDALYEVNDELQIHFTSTAQVEDKGAQGGVAVDKQGKSMQGNGAKYKCREKCDDFDLKCLFLEGCYEDIGLIVLFAVLILCGGPFLIKMVWRCWVNHMPSGSGTKRRERYEYRSRDRRRRKRRHRVKRLEEEDSESTSRNLSSDHESNKRERRRRRKKRFHNLSSAKKQERPRHRVKERRVELCDSDDATSNGHT